MEKRKRLLIVVGALALFVFVLVTIYVLMAPQKISIPNDTATIRLPGESKKQATFLYNDEYVEQTQRDSVLTLTFKKQGYYMCSVEGKKYEFEVLNIDNSDYTVDLIYLEHSRIRLTTWTDALIICSGISVSVFCVFAIVASKKRRAKSSDYEVE